ncbi:MAG: hypothetical protein V1732_04090 [Patescibacteria group bacterium]
MKENNFEVKKESQPMPLEEYKEIIERLEKGEKFSEIHPDFSGDQESWLSTVFGNGLMQYKPTESEEKELKELQDRAVQMTEKIRENK